MSEMHNNYDVEGARALQTFQGRAIVSLNDGQRLGTVDDVLIDLDHEAGSARIYALVTGKSGLLRQEVNAVAASEVFLWGQDVVLVKQSDALVKRDTMTGVDNCLSAFHAVPGRDVISQGGERLGELRDLLITRHGDLAGVVVDRIRGDLVELLGEKRGERRLPVAAVHSFGRDVLILDLHKVREMEPPDQPSAEEVI